MIILEVADGRRLLPADCWACGDAFEGNPETVAIILIDPATGLPPDVAIGEDRKAHLLTDHVISAEERALRPDADLSRLSGTRPASAPTAARRRPLTPPPGDPALNCPAPAKGIPMPDRTTQLQVAEHMLDHARDDVVVLAAANLADLVRRHRPSETRAMQVLVPGASGRLLTAALGDDAMREADACARHLADETWSMWECLADEDVLGTNLTGADLLNADLLNADLTDAILTGANLTDAFARGAELAARVGELGTQLAAALGKILRLREDAQSRERRPGTLRGHRRRRPCRAVAVASDSACCELAVEQPAARTSDPHTTAGSDKMACCESHRHRRGSGPRQHSRERPGCSLATAIFRRAS